MPARSPFPARALGAVVLLLALLAVAAGAAEPPETLRWPSSVGEVVFDHRMHVEDLEVECVACHHETVAKPLADPHPDYFEGFWVDCATCHGAATSETAGGARSCSDCHPSTVHRPRVDLPTVKVAVHQSCWSCHESGRGVEASASCATCHRPGPDASAVGR